MIFLFAEVSEAMSRVCVVQVESMNQACRDLTAQDRSSPPLPISVDNATLGHFTVKQEKPEEETDGSACCLESIKVEDFSPECMLAVHSKSMEEWKHEVLDNQEQDSDSPLSFTGPQGEKRNNVCLIHTECLFDSHRSSEGDYTGVN